MLRDTAVLLFTTKLADGSLFQLLRGGTDDVFNRVLGSATAGALITSVLFASPRVSQVVRCFILRSADGDAYRADGAQPIPACRRDWSGRAQLFLPHIALVVAAP